MNIWFFVRTLMNNDDGLNFINFIAINVNGLKFTLAKSPNVSGYIIVSNMVSEIIKPEEEYNKMMDVLTHQRCMNCHPNDKISKQGNNDKCFEATNCNACH